MLERGATGPCNFQPLDFVWMVTPLGLLKVSVLESLFVCPMIINTVEPGLTVWVHTVSAVARVRVAYPVMPVSVESSKGTCHRPESLHVDSMGLPQKFGVDFTSSHILPNFCSEHLAKAAKANKIILESMLGKIIN